MKSENDNWQMSSYNITFDFDSIQSDKWKKPNDSHPEKINNEIQFVYQFWSFYYAILWMPFRLHNKYNKIAIIANFFFLASRQPVIP